MGVPDAEAKSAEAGEPTFPVDVEEEANSHYESMYKGTLSIDGVVALLQRLSVSGGERDETIFACMIKNLFDEVAHFSKYPDRELALTSALFGQLVRRLIVRGRSLGIALGYILEALQQPADGKLFRFGALALREFAGALLPRWPSYAQRLQRIGSLQAALGAELWAAVAGPWPDGAGDEAAARAMDRAVEAALDEPRGLANGESGGGFGAGGPAAASLAATTPAATNGAAGANGHRGGPTIFTALQLDTLIDASAKGRYEVPSEAAQEKILFTVNNVAQDTLDDKAQILRSLLAPEHYRWFANYIVVKRASIEPNYHQLYVALLELLDAPHLVKHILHETLQNCWVLLNSEKTLTSSSERTLLKNLGVWLGALTLARDKPIRHKNLAFKDLLFEGYANNRLLVVIPFVCKVLEQSKDSRIFRPPNPWLMGNMRLLAELYHYADLKLHLKFEIEVLCKSIQLDILHLEPSKRLRLQYQQQQAAAAAAAAVASGRGLGDPAALGDMDKMAQTLGRALALGTGATGAASRAGPVAAGPRAGSLPPSTLSTLAPSQQQQNGYAGLAGYVAINPQLALFQSQPGLKRIVHLAIERGIREIVTPVVERSVTIANIATKELVTKDFALEPNEEKMKLAAHCMAQSLAGSLATVTCREPLRMSMLAHMRSLFLQNGITEQAVPDQMLLVLVGDNLDMACSIIEKLAGDKAILEIDETLSGNYAARRKHRETSSQTFFDVAVYTASRYPAALPETLRVKQMGLTPLQMKVYEDFVRVGRDAGGQDQYAAAAAAANAAAAAAAAARLPLLRQAAARQALSGPAGASSNGADADASLAAVAAATQGSAPSSAQPPAQPRSGLPAAPPAAATALQARLPQAAPTSAPSVNGATLSTTSASLQETVFTEEANAQLALDKLTQFVGELQEVVSSHTETFTSIEHLPATDQTRNVLRQLPGAMASFMTNDLYAAVMCQRALQYVFSEENALLQELYVVMLERLCALNKRAAKEVQAWLVYADAGEKYANVRAMAALSRSGVVALGDLDAQLARQIAAGSLAATELATALIERSVLGETPWATPVDFLCSGRALEQLGSGATAVASVVARLRQRTLLPAAPTGDAAARPERLREHLALVFTEWVRLWHHPSADASAHLEFVQQLQNWCLLQSEDVSSLFFRVATEIAVETYLKHKGNPASPPGAAYQAVDAYAQLVVLLIRFAPGASASSAPASSGGVEPVNAGDARLSLATKVLSINVLVLVHSHERRREHFNQRPFFRLFSSLLKALASAEHDLPEHVSFHILTALSNTLHTLQPCFLPGFAFAWLQLVAHRHFMPRLLAADQQRGWPFFQQLLLDLFAFLFPVLERPTGATPPPPLSDAVRLLYRGTLRLLLVLLHDFPEFLCDYHYALVDAVRGNCVQLRNLILSAFPRNMRLPDPFTLNLNVDAMPEIHRPPRILSDYRGPLAAAHGVHASLLADVESFLAGSDPSRGEQLLQRLPELLRSSAGSLDRSLVNALVLVVGVYATTHGHHRPPAGPRARRESGSREPGVSDAEAALLDAAAESAADDARVDVGSSSVLLLQRLSDALDPEGRYLLLGAMANHLRYPNSHTHFFGCVLLHLFADAKTEIVQEQVTRVLLERLIVNRPHPYGLLTTFIELIRRPRYNFWEHTRFIRCAPEIERLFESVARSISQGYTGSVQKD